MNPAERKVTGRMTNWTAPISVSSWRATSASAFESAPTAHASSTEAAISTARRRCRRRKRAPDGQPEPDQMTRLDRDRDRELGEPPGDERAAGHG